MSVSTSITIKRKAKNGVSYCIDTSVESVVISSKGIYTPSELDFQCYIVTGGVRELYSGIVGMLFYNKSKSLINYSSSGSSSCYGMTDTIPSNTAFIECVFFNESVRQAVDIYAYKKQGGNVNSPIPLCTKTIPVVNEGSEGSPGPAIRPCGLWKSGVALVNNDDYIDVVCIENSNGEAEFYKLKDSYSSNSGFTTSNPSSDSTHYEKAQNLGFVASSVLLGKSGYINVLGSSKILVSNDGKNGWELTNGKIRHTVTGVELTQDGYINDPNGLHMKVGNITSNAILQPHANLFPDPIFQFGMPYTKVSGNAISNSTMSGYVDLLGVIGDTFNYFSPWQADGGKIMRMGIASNSYGSDVNVYAYTNAPTGDWRIKLIAGKTYTFSVWVRLSGDVMSNITPNALLAEINFWANETTTSDRASQVHIPLSNKCGSIGGFTQYYLTFVVPAGHEYFTWMPLVTIAKNKYNFYISYAACKLEMSNVPTELDYNPNNALVRKLLQTGIDIEGNEILMTADNFKLQNNSGKRTFYVDDYGNACLAGYLTENMNVIQSEEDFFSTFIPCYSVVALDDENPKPKLENVTYYSGTAHSVKGAQLFCGVDCWAATSRVVNSSVAHGHTVATTNTICASLDMRCATGIISLDWMAMSGTSVMPFLIALPFLGVTDTNSCYGVCMSVSETVNSIIEHELAVCLKPNYNFSGSNVFKNTEAVKVYYGTTSNSGIHHGSEANVVSINGVVCNTLVPSGYSLYFNIRGYKMTGSSSYDRYTYIYAANAMRYHNTKTANRFIKSATPYFFWKKADGTRTTPKSFSTLVSDGFYLAVSDKKQLKVDSTYKELYVFIRVVVGPNKDNTTGSETYDTNETMFCKYSVYELDFLRTPTRMNNSGIHYIEHHELLSLIGHRFVIVNNTGTDVFMINRSNLNSGPTGQYLMYQEPNEEQIDAMIRVSNGTSLGFTLVCDDYKYAETIAGTSVRFPLIYWKPDEFYNAMLKNSDLTTDVWGGEISLE